MIRPEERDYERIEPSIRGIGDQEGERGETHDTAGRRQARRKQAVRQQAQNVIRREGGLGRNGEKAARAEAKSRRQAEIHTGPEPSVEEIRSKSEERLETNHWIMTPFSRGLTRV